MGRGGSGGVVVGCWLVSAAVDGGLDFTTILAKFRGMLSLGNKRTVTTLPVTRVEPASTRAPEYTSASAFDL